MLPTVLDLGKGILSKHRASLARAITLIESSVPAHREQAELLLEFLVKSREVPKNHAFTIGIAGPPGAGKSTFIETMGLKLLDMKRRLAVIPVDPSSHITGGSIMGDKTRMETLSKSEDAYIRASPTRGVLGGVAEHTSDVLFLCAAAGYDSSIVESVGLGQSEVEIDQVVDMLLLVVPPGGGDDLQASKKGIVEAADMILINKADGDLLPLARSTKSDYAGSLRFVRRKYRDWSPDVFMMSARTGVGIDEVIHEIDRFRIEMNANGALREKRLRQQKHLMETRLRRLVIAALGNHDGVAAENEKIQKKLADGEITAGIAARRLFQIFMK